MSLFQIANQPKVGLGQRQAHIYRFVFSVVLIIPYGQILVGERCFVPKRAPREIAHFFAFFSWMLFLAYGRPQGPPVKHTPPFQGLDLCGLFKDH